MTIVLKINDKDKTLQTEKKNNFIHKGINLRESLILHQKKTQIRKQWKHVFKNISMRKKYHAKTAGKAIFLGAKPSSLQYDQI